MKLHLHIKQNLIYLEAQTNYTLLHFEDGSKTIHSYSLKNYEKYLQNTLAYSRIHRSYLVNRKYIAHQNDTEVLLTCGKILPVARRRRV